MRCPSLLAAAAGALFVLGVCGDAFSPASSPGPAALGRGLAKQLVRPGPAGARQLTRRHAAGAAAAGVVASRGGGGAGVKDARLTPPYAFSKQQFVYVVLTSLFVTCLIVADVIGVKIFELTLPFSVLGFKTVEHTCGMLTFPVTFLLGDIINEYYGPKATRTTVYIGLAMSIFVFGMMNIAQALPYLDRPFNVSPLAFNTIFGSAKLMYVASIIAYLVGQLIDIWLFGVIKRLTRGNYLWLRATGSTVISQLLDSFVVSWIAFGPGKTFAGQVGQLLLLLLLALSFAHTFARSSTNCPTHLTLPTHLTHAQAPACTKCSTSLRRATGSSLSSRASSRPSSTGCATSCTTSTSSSRFQWTTRTERGRFGSLERVALAE